MNVVIITAEDKDTLCSSVVMNHLGEFEKLRAIYASFISNIHVDNM